MILGWIVIKVRLVITLLAKVKATIRYLHVKLPRLLLKLLLRLNLVLLRLNLLLLLGQPSPCRAQTPSLSSTQPT